MQVYENDRNGWHRTAPLTATPVGRLPGWNQNQPAIVHFAPGAHVTLAEFDEKDWTIIAVPINGGNFLLAGVNSNERPRPDDRAQGVVIHSDVSGNRWLPAEKQAELVRQILSIRDSRGSMWHENQAEWPLNKVAVLSELGCSRGSSWSSSH